MEALAELRGEPAVGFCLVGEECIAACDGTVQKVKERGSRWLLLVGDVRVPRHGVCALFEEILAGGVVGATVDEVDLGKAVRRSRSRVDVVAAEVAYVVEGILDIDACKILVPERHDLALGDEECELVFSGLRQLAKLDAADFGADVGGELGYFAAFEEVGELLVGIFAVVVVLKGNERLIVCILSVVIPQCTYVS